MPSRKLRIDTTTIWRSGPVVFLLLVAAIALSRPAHSADSLASGTPRNLPGATPTIAPKSGVVSSTLTVIRAGSGSGTVTGSPGSISCGLACSDSLANGTPVTLSATPVAGSNQFTGWLGPCTGAGNCAFTVGADTTVVATFADLLIGTPNLDIDGNDERDPLTDGLLVLRYLFGLSGSALTAGAIGDQPARTTPGEIGAYLLDIRPMLDIDGNGQADALTDGLMIIRYLFGLRGDALIANAIGPGATRSSVEGIEALIQSLKSPAVTLALSLGVLGTGNGTVTSAPAGIACSSDCAHAFNQNAIIALTAVAGPDSAFGGWGAACAGAGACMVTLDAAKSVTATFTLNAAPPPPADPTVGNNIFADTSFLYAGANPPQTGVAPGTIVSTRAGVLRGTVHARDGAPLPGVTITVMGHPEFGQTLTRSNGVFDLAANGGKTFTVNYVKAGFLPAQRQVPLRWRRYEVLPDVVMIPVDPVVTPITAGAGAMQVVIGSTVSDGDGARRAVLLFPPGTTATMTLPNGMTQPLSTLNVRATEYTVGAMGANTMPGELPPTSGYTYAVELSADEAIAAGAVSVDFSQPATFYGENFLGFPVGALMPAGYYDKVRGLWVPAENGRVLKVIGITGGMIDLDLDGDGLADGAAALDALGITDLERQTLVPLFAVGQGVWRVAVPHFSPWDYNKPIGPPKDAKPPKPKPKPKDRPKGGDPCQKGGSIIECQTQVLGEMIGVTGIASRLHYQSDRVPGRPERMTIEARISEAVLPPGLQKIHVEVHVAGRVFKEQFAPQPSLLYKFTWDGRDAYGRLLPGTQRAKVRVGYEYIGQYYTTQDSFEASFNRFANPPIGTPRLVGGGNGGAGGGGGAGAVAFSRITGRTTAPPIVIWQEFEALVGSFDSRAQALGGWSLSQHHVYDIEGRILYLGDGRQRSADTNQFGLIFTIGGLLDGNADGIPAINAAMYVADMVVGPDNSLYFSDPIAHRVRKIGPDGIISTFAGVWTNGVAPAGAQCQVAPCGDGGPATSAALNNPRGLTLAPDGSIYFTDSNFVRKVAPNGIISTIAGLAGAACSSSSACGDGGPAAQARLTSANGIAAAPDGSLYIADISRVRRIGPDGTIVTIAGTGLACTLGDLPCGDGDLATAAKVSASAIALGPDGTLYISEYVPARIRRISNDGIITTIAGTGVDCGSPSAACGDGGPAIAAQMTASAIRLAPAADGSIYFADGSPASISYGRFRRIGADGIMTTVAGTGIFTGVYGDGGPPPAAETRGASAVAVGPDGTLYGAHAGRFNNNIRAITPGLPGVPIGDFIIAAEDGTEVYYFDPNGRHLRTVDAVTGANVVQFAYDGNGRLTAMTDGDGLVTTIQRDAGGAPTAIVSPGGQSTALTVNANGYLASVTNPVGASVQLMYYGGTAEGLLSSLADPRGNVHFYTYDGNGRLTRDDNPAGGFVTLSRNDLSDDRYVVTLATAMGLVTSYDVENLANGDTRRIRTDPSGAQTITLARPNGTSRTTAPDGTITDVARTGDPRFGMQAPLIKSMTVTTPLGAVSTRTVGRTVTLSNVLDVFSMTGRIDTYTVSGKASTSTWNSATKKITTNTPVGRQSTITLDALGRVIDELEDTSAGQAQSPAHTTFDSRGRISKIQQGTQSWDFAYDAQDRLTGRTDAAGHAMGYVRDAANWRTTVTVPSGKAYGFGYDLAGNLAQLTMPALGVHALGHNPVNLDSSYTPPGNNPYVVARDLDGRITSITLPGGRAEAISYDGGGRPVGIAYPEGTVAYGYAAGDLSDRISAIARAPSGGGTTQGIALAYDGGLLTGKSMTGTAIGQYAYQYDTNFLLKSTTLTSGLDTVTTARTRDNDSLLTGLGPFTFARAGPAGRLSQIADSSTMTTALTYDGLGRMATRAMSVSGTQKYALQLTFNNVGLVTQKVETVAGTPHTWVYAYDSDSHLTSVTRDAVTVEQYTYDSNRNRASRQLGADPVQAATYDAQDRLQQQGALAHQFDGDGFLTQRGADTFAYSATGELLSATAAGQNVTYAHDGLRRRVARTSPAGTTQYLYGNPDDDLLLTHSRDGAGTLTTYFHDEARRLFALQRGAARYYVATDQLGSPRVVTDSTGALVRVIEYDAFGGIVADSNPAFDLAVGFAGGLADDITGLVRFGFRDYDPAAGRWTARDPVLFNGGQTNLYGYVNNNPVNLLDPAGTAAGSFSICDYVCVGVKLGITRDGISACLEAGVGKGGSALEIDPLGDLEKAGFSGEAKVSAKAGPVAASLGLQVDDCLNFKPKGEACFSSVCTKYDEKLKGKFSLNTKDGGSMWKDPFKSEKPDWGFKVAGKYCQEARW